MALDFPAIDPIAISLGPLAIRWYALAYLVGFLLAWRYALSMVGRDETVRPNRLDIEDFMVAALLGVVLGGRIGYVLFYNLESFVANPLEILKLWQGGMSFHGGALGVIIAIFVFAWLRKIPTFKLADIVVCTVPIGLFLGRIANFINGELFGRATDVPWAVKFPAGGYVPRHPSQLYEAVLEGLLLFFILWLLRRQEWVRARPGVLAAVFLIGYAAFRSIAELFREPDAHIGFILGDAISMGQVLSLPMILGGALVLALAMFRKPAA
jgi:phosphatidylglycerol:prolipoprotein diacylglycerol transferase